MPLTGFDIDDAGPSSAFDFLESKFYEPEGMKENESATSSSSLSSSALDHKEVAAQRRREKDRIRARERRSKESEESRRDRREKCRLAQARRRQEETEEQRQHRLAVDRERAKKRRMKETGNQKQFRLEMNRVRTAIRRQGTVENTIEALQTYHEDPEVKALMTMPGNKIIQIEDSSDPSKITIAVANDAENEVFYKLTSFRKETDEQRKIRLEKGRVYAARKRMQENPEQRRRRLERERNSTRKRRQKDSEEKSRSNSVIDLSGRNSVEKGMEEIHQKEMEASISERDKDKIPENPISEPLSLQPQEIMDFPQPSTSVDPLSFNECLLGSNPLGVQTFSNSDISNLFDISQIYSQVLQPSVSLADSPWPTATESALKDRNDMYLMQNFGLDPSASPLPTTANIFGSLNPPPHTLQTTQNLFHEETNPMTIGMLLRNLSNNQQVMEGNSFNSSFNPNSFLGAGPSVLGTLERGSIDSILQMGSSFNNINTVQSPMTLNLNPEIGEPERQEIQENLGSFFVPRSPERGFEVQNKEPEEENNSRPPRNLDHFNPILRNSIESLILLFETTVNQLQKERCKLDFSTVLRPCLDMSLLPNNGLHLVVSVYLVENESQNLKDLYYTSLFRLLKIKDRLQKEQLIGEDSDDKCALSEMYDTIRSLYLELVNIIFEKKKNETTDTSCFNAIERAELSMKKARNKGHRGYNNNKKITFLDFALVELLDFLDHIAQITWIVFPYLSRERTEIRNSTEYQRLRAEVMQM
ncbi:hypothetical protein FO519_008432 [Halicephalobus sp. NKZ332]|nr:hypothetical protein FO519_008432 [Halicephalobus sp. NKZ332]